MSIDSFRCVTHTMLCEESPRIWPAGPSSVLLTLLRSIGSPLVGGLTLGPITGCEEKLWVALTSPLRAPGKG